LNTNWENMSHNIYDVHCDPKSIFWIAYLINPIELL
jgi:hypothetical protein